MKLFTHFTFMHITVPFRACQGNTCEVCAYMCVWVCHTQWECHIVNHFNLIPLSIACLWLTACPLLSKMAKMLCHLTIFKCQVAEQWIGTKRTVKLDCNSHRKRCSREPTGRLKTNKPSNNKRLNAKASVVPCCHQG